MLTYATPEQLAAAPWNVQADNADALIRSASLLVSRATRLAVYDVDEQGMPVPGPVADAMRDATLAQATAWHRTGYDPVRRQGPRRVASKSIGGASISYTDDGTPTADPAALTVEAVGILATAGLLTSSPAVLG